MLISEIIDKIKQYHKGVYDGVAIDEETTRDKVLYGNVNHECTGIVTTCWATVEVIKEAHRKNANLIICHEALFWNHGDHQKWLDVAGNKTYLAKKRLLDEYGITVWRNHDYIHSGIPCANGEYVDGIFYGLAKKLGWENYIEGHDSFKCLHYTVPEMTMGELAKILTEKLGLNGCRVIGSKDTKVKKVRIPFHIFGDANEFIEEADKDTIDCFLTMECVDFTLTEYVRDSSLLGLNKSIIGFGHFNLEEPGMEYMLEWLPNAIGNDINISYVQSGDNYDYYTCKDCSR